MIAAAWRYWRAARALRRHQAEHGDLTSRALHEPPRSRACGLPVAGTGYGCTEWADHEGPHRSLLREDPLPRCDSTVAAVRCSLQPDHGGLHRGTMYDRHRRPTSAVGWV